MEAAAAQQPPTKPWTQQPKRVAVVVVLVTSLVLAVVGIAVQFSLDVSAKRLRHLTPQFVGAACHRGAAADRAPASIPARARPHRPPLQHGNEVDVFRFLYFYAAWAPAYLALGWVADRAWAWAEAAALSESAYFLRKVKTASHRCGAPSTPPRMFPGARLLRLGRSVVA